MKMYGSTYADTLIGTTLADTIYANFGNDLISTGGGRDKIYGEAGDDLMTGFSVNLKSLGRSPSLGATADGGSGSDALIIEVTAAARVSYVTDVAQVMTIKNTEDIIYNFSGVGSKQLITGSKGSETICVTSGNASIKSMKGSDYIFSGSGNDVLEGGDGDDFISAGTGHNVLSGGAGADKFMFHFKDVYQYNQISDFNVAEDKIAILIDLDQHNLAYGTDIDVEYDPVHKYGDGVQGVGSEINEYVTYNNQRLFDRNTFDFDVNDYAEFITYEQSTGSVLLNFYEEDDDGTVISSKVLIAHIDGNKNLDSSNFEFLLF